MSFHCEILVFWCQNGRPAPSMLIGPDVSTVNVPQCTSLICLYNIPTGQEIKPIHSLPLKPFKSFLTEAVWQEKQWV